ncbi:MAG TPA: nitrilase-related carbon-nitrogen hydrolase [Bacteriovoracaceae bacterium]|nr:nitrilase-related carbon-nitrogen hydrolase [Bacteriovoracaceae bacterium]
MKNYVLVVFLFIYSCANTKDLSSKPVVEPSELIKVAVVNFKVNGNSNLEKHLSRIAAWAQQASEGGASYLLLPELIVLDFFPHNPPDSEVPTLLQSLSEMSSAYEKSLVEISKRWKVNLIGASVVIKHKKHYLNRAFYINHSGKVHYQDKLQPTPWEIKHQFTGSKELKIFKNPDFKFVILICHDAEFPDISASLIKAKPEVIFVPSQTDGLKGLNRVKYTSAARAIEHMSYVLMTGTAGDEKAPWHSYIGQNFLFTPQNEYFPADNQSGKMNMEEISFFSLDLIQLRKARGDNKQIYPARDSLPIKVSYP